MISADPSLSNDLMAGRNTEMVGHPTLGSRHDVEYPVSSGESAGQTETIKIFGRVRPCKDREVNSKKRYTLDQPEPGYEDTPQLHFYLPKDEHQGLINNSRETYDFKFNRVFDQRTSQEEVFDRVAKDVVDSVLDGYNGTIFAYGQTSSGKTYTITGSPERYADRGLIPRSIQYIFKKIREDTEHSYSISVSYLEIYNETGYDLLDGDRDMKRLEDMPKVMLMEDLDENIHLKNLSVQNATTEEEALNLLFIGDTNKMIAETPSNPASSRSHCIFTINLVAKRNGDDRIRKSKLHLVDLAGSERVSRTKIDGTILKEAKYINLSLHYLEQVIIALHEKSQGKRSHIPYRNSMMTSILRDSLGGNCKTTMIATIAVEQQLMDESISTCRFAQRVAMIRNTAMINEEVDLKALVESLKKQIESLRAELALLKGGHVEGDLPEYEKERVKSEVDAFLSTENGSDRLVLNDFRKIQEAFRIMKGYIKKSRVSQSSAFVEKPGKPVEARPKRYSEQNERVSTVELQQSQKHAERLEEQIRQRDNEIAILLKMLNDKNPQQELPKKFQAPVFTKETKNIPSGETMTVKPETSYQIDSVKSQKATPEIVTPAAKEETKQIKTPTPQNKPVTQLASKSAVPEPVVNQAVDPPSTAPSVPQPGVKISAEDKQNAFTEFMAAYAPAVQIEQQKQVLKDKFAYAKQLAARAQEIRQSMNELKSKMEKHHMRAFMIEDKNEIEESQRQSESMRAKMTELKGIFKSSMEELQDVKRETDHIQHGLQQSRLKLQADFEKWWCRRRLGHQLSVKPDLPLTPRQAWQSVDSLENQKQQISSILSDTQASKVSSTTNVNDDIRAFVRAKESLLQKQRTKSRQSMY